MTLRLLDGIRRLQEHIFEVGLARSILALPAPRMLALPSPTAEESEPASVFARVVTEPEIQSVAGDLFMRSEEHTSELQSLMRISYAVFCLKKKKNITEITKLYDKGYKTISTLQTTRDHYVK